jgi:hypothetical protein
MVPGANKHPEREICFYLDIRTLQVLKIPDPPVSAEKI